MAYVISKKFLSYDISYKGLCLNRVENKTLFKIIELTFVLIFFILQSQTQDVGSKN